MCDPLTAGTLAIGLAGTAASSIGQMNAQKKQEAEYNAWVKQQTDNRRREYERQDKLRGQAEVSRQEGLADIAVENQRKLQEEEAARLSTDMLDQPAMEGSLPPAPVSVADAALAGGADAAGDQVFQSDLAKQLSDAAASAKKRIEALATVNSYTGSQRGLGMTNAANQTDAARAIDAANNARQGSIGVYGTEQAVDPVQISYSNPIADMASQFLGVGMGELGKTLSGALGKGLASTLPATTTAIPTPRPSLFPATMTPPGFRPGSGF